MKKILSFILLVLFVLNSFATIDSKSNDGNWKNDSLEMAKLWFKRAVDFDDGGNTEKGNETAREALRLASLVKDYQLMGRCMNFLAINLSAEGKRSEGIAMSYQAFDNFMLSGDTVRAANVKINIGMDYNNQGKYEEALKVELEALDLRLLCGDSTNLATYYQRIGEVYKDLGIHEKWKSSLESAHRLSQNPKYASFKTQIGILNDYGGIYESEKRYDEAVNVYLDMYNRSKKENYLNGMATALTNLSPVYRNLGLTEKALESAKEALLIQTKRENTYGRLTTHNQLGEIYLSMNQYDMAYSNFNEGLKLAVGTEYVSDQKESLKGLYRVARHKGNWKDALVYNEKWSLLKDSLQNIDLQERLTNLETRYQTEKKEQQIELLNSENQLKNSQIKYQNLTIWGGGVFFIILSAFAFFIVRQKRNQQISRQNELEQKLLRSQMNPHFIFNSLGAIQSFMLKSEGRKAAFYLSSFSSLMRSILKNSREELITLLEEKKTIENYLQLHQLRLGDKFSFNIDISEDLDVENTLLPPMLIQPFVENAILHGIEKLEENGRLSVTFNKEGKYLIINVEDNGQGIGPNLEGQNNQYISYALQIFRERIANLKKTMGTKIFYTISNKGLDNVKNHGTLVTVKLLLKTV